MGGGAGATTYGRLKEAVDGVVVPPEAKSDICDGILARAVCCELLAGPVEQPLWQVGCLRGGGAHARDTALH